MRGDRHLARIRVGNQLDVGETEFGRGVPHQDQVTRLALDPDAAVDRFGDLEIPIAAEAELSSQGGVRILRTGRQVDAESTHAASKIQVATLPARAVERNETAGRRTQSGCTEVDDVATDGQFGRLVEMHRKPSRGLQFEQSPGPAAGVVEAALQARIQRIRARRIDAEFGPVRATRALDRQARPLEHGVAIGAAHLADAGREHQVAVESAGQFPLEIDP